MFESQPQQAALQNSEQRTNDPVNALTTYINRKLLAPLRERSAMFANAAERGGVQQSLAQNLNANNEGLSEEEHIPQEIARFERMRQRVQERNFTGIAIELQARRAASEAEIARLQSQGRPRGEMARDDEYFALKEAILTGEKIQAKVQGVLNDTELAWIAQRVEDQKRKQGGTPRGELMGWLTREKRTLDEITHLQQLLSQPPNATE